MLDLDLRALLGRLNPTCTACLNTAAGVCLSRGHHEITIEHLLDALLDENDTDIPLIFEHFHIDHRAFKELLRQQLDAAKAGSPGKPVFSTLLIEWLQDAWLIGSVEYGHTEIRSGVLLLALALRSSRYATGAQTRLLGGISRERLRADLHSILSASRERGEAVDDHAPGADPGSPTAGSALARFTVDFTLAAQEGRIDPVFGRDQEIRQMIDVLARRRKNNPILVGEPGVGKTAVAEGLAHAIAAGVVPQAIAGVKLLSLDLGALTAGAGVKGEFENRVKAVINEVKSSAIPIILFIDEAHSLIGSGGAEGGSDAANLFKPALARGELRTIAATTWREYKKYFEKDPALARRFEVVHVPEPSPSNAAIMLRGLAARYAEAHGVHIQDAAVVAAVELSHRYLSGRQLPDKAVGLLDTAAARVRIGQSSAPSRLEGLRRRIEQTEREQVANQRDVASGVPAVEDRRSTHEQELARLRQQAYVLDLRWREEQRSVERVIGLRRELLAEPTTEESAGSARRAEPELRAELESALAELSRLQEGEPLVFADVSPDTVAAVVSEWTGIPVGRLVADEASAVLRFEEELGQRIKGQGHALGVLGERIRQAKAGLQEPTQPIGVFLLVGPSGVGKTETALGLAELMYGGERSVISINMSEFKDKSTVNRLIGSPPGYVGYGEGGKLTEAVRQRPYSVVLLDECEKADPEVMELFYQVFDKGTLADGEGREVDFRNTVILLTSNLATQQITELAQGGLTDDPEQLISRIRPTLSRHFKPALLARMTIVPYYPLPPETLRAITSLKLQKIARRLLETHKLALVWDEDVADQIAARCTEVETGARNVDHILRGTVLPLLSREILGRIGVASAATGLALRLDPGGRILVVSP